jgi:hypothetical protein
MIPSFSGRSAVSALILVLFEGCSGGLLKTNRVGLTPVTIAITMPNGGSPSTKQLLTIYEILGPALAEQGFEFETSTGVARDVVVVHFIPDQFSKDGGHVQVIGIQPKPRKSIGKDPSTDADAVIRRALASEGGTPR